MGWKAAGHLLGCLKDPILYYCSYSVCSDSNTVNVVPPPTPLEQMDKDFAVQDQSVANFLKCSVPGELPLGPHQVFYLLHLFYSNVRTSDLSCCKRQPFTCDRYSHLCVESNRSQDELDLSLVRGGRSVNEGRSVVSCAGSSVDLRRSQPWRMWRAIPKQTNQG